MSLPPQVKGVDSFGSRTSRENSPRSTLHLNQDQERSPTSDLYPHLEEEAVNGNTIDLSEAAACRKYVVVTILLSLAAMFRKRERNLLFGGIQNETAESAGQTAKTIQDLYQNLIYKIGQMDLLRADYNQLRMHDARLNDKLRASEFEISELRKKNEALKTIRYKVLSNDGNGGKRDGNMAGSDIHVSVSPTGPAKKKGKFE
ncbi:hypothetical protein V493_01525 [Pseudogymnoascus sp. VKM F-4281 (FW-2241)]|nr:hypothetical protein V493_01525 [Pseudogymnoascus sp. VKM F-4281 (FW-2241)]